MKASSSPFKVGFWRWRLTSYILLLSWKRCLCFKGFSPTWWNRNNLTPEKGSSIVQWKITGCLGYIIVLFVAVGLLKLYTIMWIPIEPARITWCNKLYFYSVAHLTPLIHLSTSKSPPLSLCQRSSACVIPPSERRSTTSCAFVIFKNQEAQQKAIKAAT